MSTPAPLDGLSFTTNRGDTVSLADFSGHPLLIVNTASKCGLTPQYEALQELQDAYAGQGLVILGFPCDQFLNQEPGTDAEIEEFCKVNYGVTFTLSTKVEVNGPGTDPIFAVLKEAAPAESGPDIAWNFNKFLVSADRTTVTRYSPKTPPAEMIPQIEALLGEATA
jgi:glutathione peroxidase